MKLMIVFGTRPQYMKAIVLFKQLRKLSDVILVDTGQHYDFAMSEVFKRQLEFPKMINLDVKSGSHARQTARIMVKIENLFMKENPNLVVVIGDTNSTLGTTLASAKLNIPTAHVEAGLRSFDRKMPEEVNRLMVDSISTLLFAPSPQSAINLRNEGRRDYHYTGDVLYDVLLENLSKTSSIKFDTDYILATVHRPSNVDNPRNLKGILEAFAKSPLPIILPLHPRTRRNIRKFGLGKKLKSLDVRNPASYHDMITFIRNAEAVITDSGGIQREAFWLRIPCVTLRDKTEWVETVQLKANHLVGHDKEKIVKILNDFPSFPRIRFQPYGRGNASEKIAKAIELWIKS